MKKLVIFSFAILFTFIIAANADTITKSETEVNKGITVSNKLFSINLPPTTKGTFQVKKKDNGIFIYDKKAKKDGFGGFAFGIKAYKNPSDHAMMPGGTKIGELEDKHSNIYDIVLIYPTDVQYNYVNGKSKTYDLLYNLGENILITGNHKNKYFKEQGMKGKDLYNDILKKHITAINEKWDSAKLEEENMSYMYNVISSSGKNALDTIGYAYYDTNKDGIEELLIGEISEGDWKGVIYDLYTMVNRKPIHVVSGGSRNRYFVCDEEFICNEYSSGAQESGWLVYVLVENSTELFPQVGFKYDGYENKNRPWFISYDITNDKWQNVSENVFKVRKAIFDKYTRFEYKPLSELVK